MSRARTVRYGYHVPDGEFSKRSVFCEEDAKRILEPACAAGIVHEYDTGRGAIVWFTGHPGAALREVRRRVRALLPSSARALP